MIAAVNESANPQEWILKSGERVSVQPHTDADIHDRVCKLMLCDNAEWGSSARSSNGGRSTDNHKAERQSRHGLVMNNSNLSMSNMHTMMVQNFDIFRV